MTEKPAVLFVCVHNAGRSQMAAAYMAELSGGAVDVLSAVSEPGDTCPIFPGKRYEDWDLTDPAGRPVDEVRCVTGWCASSWAGSGRRPRCRGLAAHERRRRP
jgi:arsenate reductase